MADKDVNLNIKTKTDARALKNLNSEMNKLTKASKLAQKEAKALAKAGVTENDQLEKLNKTIKIGEEAKSGLRKESIKLKKENEKLSKALEKEANKLDKLTKEANKAAAAEKNLATTTGKTTAATGKVIKAEGKAKKSKVDLGRSTLMLSQGYEDLQFGIMGVLNNITPLVLSLGGTAGLAGVIGIATVAAAQMGDVFNSTKTAVKGFGEVLDEINTAKLDEFKAATDDVTSIEAYTNALNRQTDALKGNTTAIDDNLASAKLARKLRLDVAKAETRLTLAEIEGSADTDINKANRRHAANQELAALIGGDQIASQNERVKSLTAGQIAAESGSQDALSRSGDLTRGTLGVGKKINRRRASATAASARSAERVEQIKEFSDGIFSEMSRSFRQTNVQGNNPTKAEQATEKREDEGFANMVDAVENLEFAITAENEKLINSALRDIVGLGVNQRAQLAKDKLLEGGSQVTPGDREINKIALAAKVALSSAEDAVRLEKEADKLAKQRSKDLSEAADLISKFDSLAAESIELTKLKKDAEDILANLVKIRAIEKDIGNKIADTENKRLIKAASDAAKKAKEIEAKARASEIKEEERELIRGGKEISRRAGVLESGATNSGLKANAGGISQNFKDGLISAIEAPGMARLLKDLKASAKARDDQNMKLLVSMIEENNKAAKRLESLTKNAKQQAK